MIRLGIPAWTWTGTIGGGGGAGAVVFDVMAVFIVVHPYREYSSYLFLHIAVVHMTHLASESSIPLFPQILTSLPFVHVTFGQDIVCSPPDRGSLDSNPCLLLLLHSNALSQTLLCSRPVGLWQSLVLNLEAWVAAAILKWSCLGLASLLWKFLWQLQTEQLSRPSRVALSLPLLLAAINSQHPSVAYPRRKLHDSSCTHCNWRWKHHVHAQVFHPNTCS